MSEDERIVRHHLRPAPSEAGEALDRLLSATRSERFAQAREQAATLAHAEAEECDRLARNAEANGNVSARQCWQAARIAAASLATRIRAMQDGVKE